MPSGLSWPFSASVSVDRESGDAVKRGVECRPAPSTRRAARRCGSSRRVRLEDAREVDGGVPRWSSPGVYRFIPGQAPVCALLTEFQGYALGRRSERPSVDAETHRILIHVVRHIAVACVGQGCTAG